MRASKMPEEFHEWLLQCPLPLPWQRTHYSEENGVVHAEYLFAYEPEEDEEEDE